VIGIFGESCTGKSTLADKLKEILNAQVYTGKDYLRFEKNEAAAKQSFQTKLQTAIRGENIIYVISEKEHLPLLPDGSIRVLVTADLELIKARFAERMHGNLPGPVAVMLERKHGCFDKEQYDIHVISEQMNLDDVCIKIQAIILKKGE
ncbi:MAG: hypothetical protein K2J93_06460, partial [Anaeroplasmataceae bacterium]|nr:hypothetical protein [Anaeroplasmataceae bacterium]